MRQMCSQIDFDFDKATERTEPPRGRKWNVTDINNSGAISSIPGKMTYINISQHLNVKLD